LSPRKFNIICIVTLIAVASVAMLMIEMSPGSRTLDLLPAQDVASTGTDSSSAYVMQPLSLGLSLTVVADMGLMTLGLVILFKDDAPGRYRAR
jgi:predicted permease